MSTVKIPTVVNNAPKSIAELDFKFNAFEHRNFAGALHGVRNFFKTTYAYEGPVSNKKVFVEGNQIVYEFYSNTGQQEYKAFVVF